MHMTDRERWNHLWQALGAVSRDPLLFDQLQSRYAESHRFYHTFDHIRDCLQQFDTARFLTERPAEAAIAIWFHDAIYDPHKSDNEERSARWAERALCEAGVPAPAPERVRDLIMVTEHKIPPVGRDASLLADIDLSILGRAPAVFDEYERQIRQEYAWLSDEAYREGRAAILRGFLARKRIYLTGHFYRLFEEQARHNLKHALSRLMSERAFHRK
jgi:predicted metal-dependent HD superfamily phosphohydrolase